MAAGVAANPSRVVVIGARRVGGGVLARRGGATRGFGIVHGPSTTTPDTITASPGLVGRPYSRPLLTPAPCGMRYPGEGWPLPWDTSPHRCNHLGALGFIFDATRRRPIEVPSMCDEHWRAHRSAPLRGCSMTRTTCDPRLVPNPRHRGVRHRPGVPGAPASKARCELVLEVQHVRNDIPRSAVESPPLHHQPRGTGVW